MGNTSPMDRALRLQAMAAEFGWSKARLTEEIRKIRREELREILVPVKVKSILQGRTWAAFVKEVTLAGEGGSMAITG